MAIGTADKRLPLFELNLRGRGLSPCTVTAFMSDVGQFLAFSEGAYPSRDGAEAWFASLHEKGLTNKTLSRKRTSLMTFIRWLKMSVELPAIKPESKLPMVLTEVEARAVLEAATHSRNGLRDHLMVDLLLRTGLRESELLGLTPESLQEDQSALFLKVIGKGAKERRIPIVSRDLVRSVRKYAKDISDGGRLFDMTARNVRKLVAAIGKRAGLHKPLHPHALRHTAATLYLRKGVNLESVRRILGHESLATTQLYLQLTDDDVAEDLARAKW